jgi:hypothetical protein
MLASWRDGLDAGKYTERDWPEFVRGWVDGVDDNNRGAAYEKFGNQAAGITGSKNWTFNEAPPGATNGAQPDANSLDPNLPRSIDYKAGSKLSPKSQAQLRKYAQNVDSLKRQMVEVFGEPPDPAARNLSQAGGVGQRGAQCPAQRHRQRPRNARPEAGVPTGWRGARGTRLRPAPGHPRDRRSRRPRHPRDRVLRQSRRLRRLLPRHRRRPGHRVPRAGPPASGSRGVTGEGGGLPVAPVGQVAELRR